MSNFKFAKGMAAIDDLLKVLHATPPERLIHGEWTAYGCCECESLANVHLYRQKGTRSNISVHLCDTCYTAMAHYGIYEREWEPGDR